MGHLLLVMRRLHTETGLLFACACVPAESSTTYLIISSANIVSNGLFCRPYQLRTLTPNAFLTYSVGNGMHLLLFTSLYTLFNSLCLTERCIDTQQRI